MSGDFGRRTRELLAHLDDMQAAMVDAISSVPPAMRERRPAPDRWSVAEIVEHLAIVERRVGQELRQKIAELRANDSLLAAADDSVLHRLDGRLVDRSRRFTTGPSSEPRQDAALDEAVSHFASARERSRALVREMDGLDLGSVSHTHPMLGTFDGYQWVLFLAGHQSRHAAQIREVGVELMQP